MVRRYHNQNYSKLKRDHQQRGELFTDPEFPPSSRSLFRSGTDKYDIVWKRPRVRIRKWEERGWEGGKMGKMKRKEGERKKGKEGGMDGGG